jgi:ABC-type antimicrobial peptide transport system permease subunit
MQRGLATVAAGVAIGLAVSFAAVRWLTDLLFGVSPNDPAILAGATLVLFALAVAANWFPARRAARVDPMRSLRTN